MRMQSYRRNLHTWISALPTPKLDIEVGPPLRSGRASAEGQRDFQQLAQSIADQISRSTKGHQILTAITSLPSANAVAFRGGMAPDVHVVIATDSLIRRMQEISAGCLEATLTQLADPSNASVLKKIWGELPVDRSHAQGFAQLLTHVAFVLVMNHEFAHVVIGHGFVKRASWIDEARELMDFTSINFAAAPSLRIDNQHSPMLQGQSMELDADLHALAWTNDYLCRFDRESESIKALGAAVENVCDKVLSDQTGRRFVLLTRQSNTCYDSA